MAVEQASTIYPDFITIASKLVFERLVQKAKYVYC